MDLPLEIWLRIFSYLNDPHFLEPLSLVSTQFLTLTNSLYITLYLNNPTAQVLPSLFLHFDNLNSIDLCYFTGDPTSILLQIPRYYPHLCSLSLCHHQNLPLEALRQIVHQMKGLKVLDISELSVLDDNDLVIVTDCFPHLEELDIGFPKCSSVTDAGISALSLKLKNLNRIGISGNPSIMDTVVVALSINCVFLKSTAIRHCSLVTPNRISCLLKNRPELEAFEVGRFANGSQIPHISQEISFKCARCLGSLELCDLLVPDKWLFLIGKGRFPLKRLNLSFFTWFFLIDNAISTISGFLSDLVSVKCKP